LLTEQDILTALKQIEDPDLHRDIVSLGFIKNISIENGHVRFDINLTTPACPVKDQMQDQAKKLVQAMPGVKSVEVKMTAEVRRTLDQNKKNTPKLAPFKQKTLPL
jgi:ATP-binding protein involved in chromosome partitioning